MPRFVTLTDKPASGRRAWRLLAPTLVLLAVALALSAGAMAVMRSGSGWVKQVSGTTEQLNAVAFIDLTRVSPAMLISMRPS